MSKIEGLQTPQHRTRYFDQLTFVSQIDVTAPFTAHGAELDLPTRQKLVSHAIFTRKNNYQEADGLKEHANDVIKAGQQMEMQPNRAIVVFRGKV